MEALLSSTLPLRSLRILLPYLAAALAAAASLLHHRRLRARYGDRTGMWLYFGAFFLLFVALPVLVVFLAEGDPLQALANMGLRAGNVGLGLAIVAVALPVTMGISFFSSKDPALQKQYPFSKAACTSDGAFIRYEIGYLCLYYTSWEFLYRGILFFPLAQALGFLPAMAITTALSTLHHIGHPESEIGGALVGGILFGVVSFLTGSVLYAFAIHAMLGVSDDVFIYLRAYRGRAARSEHELAR
jgi:membrane protease YdiL (CAAX protease family)